MNQLSKMTPFGNEAPVASWARTEKEADVHVLVGELKDEDLGAALDIIHANKGLVFARLRDFLETKDASPHVNGAPVTYIKTDPKSLRDEVRSYLLELVRRDAEESTQAAEEAKEEAEI